MKRKMDWRTTFFLIAVTMIVFLMLGCGNEENPDFVPFGARPGYHPFGEVQNHGDYVVSAQYDFDECTDCHGEDLAGQQIGSDGETVRSCYECHSSENHLIGFDDARSDHPAYIRQNNWDLSTCYNCHTNLPQVGGIQFGGSCSSFSCHSSASNGAEACNVCHGEFGANASQSNFWAPPADLDRNISTSFLGVGAHQPHLLPSDDFADIECEVCHHVPESLNEAGHIGGNNPGQSEIIFGYPANAESANPVWNRNSGTCSSTYCHGNDQPVWTEVDGSWNSCDNCHGIPSDGPHQAGLTYIECYQCHGDVIDQNGIIINPELHVNGVPD